MASERERLECVRERNGVYHLVGGPDEGDAEWRPIACSDTEGIVLPGSNVKGKPTCPDCIAVLAERRASRAS